MSLNFQENIKKWVGLDNQLKILNEKAKNIRTEKNELNETIIEYVETNSLDNATIKISDGRLRFGQTKQTCPLTLKLIDSSFIEILRGSIEAFPEVVSVGQTPARTVIIAGRGEAIFAWSFEEYIS